MAELAQDVALEAAGDEQLRRDSIAPGLCSQAARIRVDLPRALARARRPQRGHAVAELGAGQELAVAEVRRRRGARRARRRAEPLGQADRGRAPRAGARSDVNGSMRCKRALGPRALEVAPHEQQRLARRRHEQVRVLGAAAEVHEVGRLHDERGVEPVAPQAGLERRDAASDLVGRRWGGSTDADDSDGRATGHDTRGVCISELPSAA